LNQHPLGTCVWDWGPTPATANQLFYTENASGDSSIYRITEGGKHPGEKLTQYIDNRIPVTLRFALVS